MSSPLPRRGNVSYLETWEREPIARRAIEHKAVNSARHTELFKPQLYFAGKQFVKAPPIGGNLKAETLTDRFLSAPLDCYKRHYMFFTKWPT